LAIDFAILLTKLEAEALKILAVHVVARYSYKDGYVQVLSGTMFLLESNKYRGMCKAMRPGEYFCAADEPAGHRCYHMQDFFFKKTRHKMSCQGSNGPTTNQL